jgi:putative PEP-CTERM system histidine kinase
LRRFISRHFERPIHDYQAIWRKFTESTGSYIEQSELTRSLVRLIAELFQALSVSIWIVNETKDKLVLAASTSPQNTFGTSAVSNQLDSTMVTRTFEARVDPADLETIRADWAAELRELHPTEFPNGGHRICVPMKRGGELLGLIVLGDRVNGEPFSPQDIDLLSCIGSHAAASVTNVQLSRRLLQAKELEAFQAMAAFFVHDLKNAASTLSLMLKNLPVHFDDPEFRADALRGISKTVSHINELIGRLSVLRHELKIQLVETDVNEVVTGALTGLGHVNGTKLVKDIQPLPPIAIDRSQLNKVITNLVLNATQAVGHNGEVHVSTAQENGWIVLTVADNGCGMSPEFLSQSLFRPFQTTKKNGLGIGMFQSKMIVEAHGGRIAVASEQGKGTTFQVFLRGPATSQS